MQFFSDYDMGYKHFQVCFVKGDLSCKMHLCTSCIHEYVSPVCQGTHQVSENTTLSLFLHTLISKNGAATDLIQTDTDLKIV